MPIKAMMVDVDGVIVVHPHAKGWSVDLERDLGVSAERLQHAFFKVHFDDVVHGRAGLHQRLAPVLAEIAPHVSAQALADYWFAHDAHLNHALLNALAEIRARGIALHLATVQEHERARYLWRDMGLCERFDGMHYSAAIGSAKPAAAFFAAVEQRSGFRGADIFFIDDKAANVEAAVTHGWNGAVWTGEKSLGQILALTTL